MNLIWDLFICCFTVLLFDCIGANRETQLNDFVSWIEMQMPINSNVAEYEQYQCITITSRPPS